jgi:MoaA/NifB/PqqE/SkfB family radical SAM enzyme/cellulose synthase/poly-beta-1,6-N-acetylglucosamine synthase-like glycosyltransferase
LGRALLPTGLPVQLTFFVTSRCNAACSHCFYGEQLNQPLQRELTVDEVDRIARGLPRQLWVAFGGGEPFLRDDLADVAEKFFRWNRPRVLTVVTNGINTDRIEEVTRQIIAKRQESFVNVAVSLDGLEKTHDRERRVPGNFHRAVETLHRLRLLRDRYRGFGFSTLTTVHGRNAHELAELERFIDEEIRPDNRGLNLVRGRPIDPTVLEVDVRAYSDAVERKRRGVLDGKVPLQPLPLSRLNAAKERVMYREVERVTRTGAYRAPCRAGRVGAVLYENGDVAACEILDRQIGNLRDFGFDFSRLWFSPQAQELRRDISKRRCRCTWECAVGTNVLFGPRYWPELLREWVTGGRRRRSSVRRAPMPKSVTVLVPCRDEALLIRRKIRNSLRLRFPEPSQCEVLVVDDGSLDESAAILEQEIADRGEQTPGLRWLPNRYEPGKAGAIRTGLEAARGEIVLLTDADVLIEREALLRGVLHFEDPATGVVCGEQVYCDNLLSHQVETPGDACNRAGGALMDPLEKQEGIYDRVMRSLRKLESRLDSIVAVHGQMMLFRRSLGLVPRTGIAADDVDLSLQARRKGFRIRYAEGARFWEERAQTLSDEVQQKKRRGMSLAQVLWANRDMVARPRYGAFGLVSLPLQWAFLLAQPIALAMALPLGIAACLAFASWPVAIGASTLALLAVTWKSSRSYLFMNGLMLSAIVSLLGGRPAGDRWPRDRDASALRARTGSGSGEAKATGEPIAGSE